MSRLASKLVRKISKRNFGPEVFDVALDFNEARLKHLDRLNLTISGKTVLDVGCGVGHLSRYFSEKNCKVLAVDVRQENLDEMNKKYPDIPTMVWNIEDELPAKYDNYFDIVFAYGILYHLENPVAALHNMSRVCKEMLLLETIICDTELPIMMLKGEKDDSDQAADGLACRPSPSFVVKALKHVGLEYVYLPTFVPDYKDFSFELLGDFESTRNGSNMRKVFVASKVKLNNGNLVLWKR